VRPHRRRARHPGLVADHSPRLDAAIGAEYGTLAPSGNAGEQLCQTTLAKQGGKYLTKYLKTVQKCINTRNKKECPLDDPVSKCLAPSLEGPKTEAKAATKIQKARDVFAAQVALACTDTQVAALDACDSTVTGAVDCIACNHKAIATVLTGEQYDSVSVATTGTGIQTVVDDAEEGDTILVEPGLYTEAVEMLDPGVSLIGLKDCGTGARAVIETPFPGVTPDGITACGSLAPSCTDVADDLLIQGLEIHNFEDNAIFVVGAEGLTIRDVITIGDGTVTGMEYGPFPILSNDVLIEDSEVIGVRDAGIYVGQSTNIVVRNNSVHGNVAGIEIENSANSQVYGNHAYGNTGGILIFKLPGLGVQLSNCNEVFDNLIEDNDLPNFGSGTVGLVPQGTGIIILSGDSVHVHDNTITGNDTFGLVTADQVILNVLSGAFPVQSPDQKVSDNYYTGNTITGNGATPDSTYGAFAGDAFMLLGDISDLPTSCQSGNTFGTPPTGVFATLAACTLPGPPGCAVTPTTTVTSTTVTSTTTSTSTTLPASWAVLHAGVGGGFVGLDTLCGGCHGGGGGLTGLGDCNLALTNMINVASTRLPTMDRIEPSDSANSFLVHKLAGTHSAFDASCIGGNCGSQMPLGGPFLASHIIDSLEAWIDAGAVNDCAP
jgi:parallel beta-helix repeat protein